MAQKKTIVIEAKDNTKQAFSKVKKNLKDTDQAVNKTKRSFDSMKGAIKGAVGALTVGAFIGATKSTLDLADALGKTSARLGLTTEALQTLRFAATQSGMSTEMLEMSLQRFTRRMAEANNGTGVLKDTFKQLGIEITKPNGQLKSAESILGDVADKMASIPEQGKRVELAFKMFDSEGVKMVNMLQGGSKAFGDLRKSLIDTGAIMTDDFIKNSEIANDALDKLTVSVKAGFASAISGLAPLITSASEGLSDLIKVAREYPTLTALATAISAIGVAFSLWGGWVTLSLTAISGLIAGGQALNNHFKTQAELTDIAGLSLDKLNKHYKNVTQELKDVNQELAEGETWWHKLGIGSIEGLQNQKTELEKVKKELEGQLTVKKEVIKAKQVEAVVDKKAYDLGQETLRQQLQISSFLTDKNKEEAKKTTKKNKDEVIATLANLKSQKEAHVSWMDEKQAMNDAGMERLQEDYERQKQLVDEAYMGELKNKELHTQNMLALDKKYEKAKIDLAIERASVLASIASGLSQQLYEEGLMGFDAMKAFAYVEALINAQVAATKALAQLGPVWGPPAAAMIYASAMFKANKIQQMKPPKRERGGEVSRGRAYMVGERGPELFTPNQSGSITSNQDMGGSANVTFNIQANDTRGFDQLLEARRGLIIGMINRAMRGNARKNI